MDCAEIALECLYLSLRKVLLACGKVVAGDLVLC